MTIEVIRQLTEFEQLDQRFASGNMSAVIKYIDLLSFPLKISTSGDGYTVEPPESEQNQLYQNSDIYLDYGDGRVSRGLRGLELLSKLCKGVDPSDLFMFHNVIYSSTPARVKEASKEELIDIVTDNVGMRYIIDAVRVSPTADVVRFDSLCYTIGMEVKAGTFKRETYHNRMLGVTKKLTILAAGRNINGRI